MSNRHSYDVVVVGGGPSGFIAAAAAGRTGARTLLIERYGFLGGMPTSASLGPISPFHYGDEQVVKGLAQTFVDRMVEAGGSTGHMKCTNPHGSGAYLCFYDRETYKAEALGLVLDSGVELLLHTYLVGTIVEDDQVVGVRVVNKSGVQEIDATVVVDATGDSDVSARAGAEYQLGREPDGLSQPVTMMFDMGNVDTDAVKRYLDGHPEDVEWSSEMVPMREFSAEIQQEHFVGQGFKNVISEGLESDELYLGRDTVLFLTTTHPGVLHFNSTRVHGVDSTDAQSLTQAEIEARRQVMSLAAFIRDRLPGFSEAYLAGTGVQVGVRESRHIVGNYTLTADDVMAGRKFDDVVARGYFPIDIHNLEGKSGYGAGGGVWADLADSYDIPYRCLVPASIKGLVVAGRGISATHEAHGSFRTQGGVMAIGHAAGVGAALAAKLDGAADEVSVAELQGTLEDQGASLRRDPDAAIADQEEATQRLQAYLAAHDVPEHMLPNPEGARAPRL